MDVQRIFLWRIQKANNGMVLTKLLLEGRKTSVMYLYFMRNAGRVQETYYFRQSPRCWTQDRKIGLKIEQMVHTLIHFGFHTIVMEDHRRKISVCRNLYKDCERCILMWRNGVKID
jgi:hypothetical protein